MPKISSPAELEDLRKGILSKRESAKTRVAVCAGTGCHNLGSQAIITAFKEAIGSLPSEAGVDIVGTGCPGLCEQGPVVVIYPRGICYTRVAPEDVPEIVSKTVVGNKVIHRLLYADPVSGKKSVHDHEIPFYGKQMRLLVGDNSKIDPKNIEDYLAIGGYTALAKALFEMSPTQVVKQMKESGLRGRSGGGFPTGRKWEAGLRADGDRKHIICNCHEGDPGAFVDRRILESNPHNVLEGMLIGAYAIGAKEGHIFVGDEFPLTIENTATAIQQAEAYGLLGKDVLGSGMDVTIEIYIDGGGYVCGESTALIAALEGRAGEPRTKYDHATERGLWAQPTVLNNLQTWANVPLIINQGAGNYASVGTKGSKGTRAFSLSGKINNGGLVEVPMGITLRDIILDIGGGIRGDGKFKAVQVGGPLGGFAPESLLDLPVDFDELAKAGLPMGPSLVVFDDSTCMVDTVKYFLGFLHDESCGKCTPCREGLRQMLKIVTRISEGHGRDGDIELLEVLSDVQKKAALCALGQGASGPLLSSLKYFRDEYDAHIRDKRCPALVCQVSSVATPKRGEQK